MRNGIKSQIRREAQREPLTTPQNILVELEALIKDYFVASVKVSEDSLVLRLPNRQHFIITVR